MTSPQTPRIVALTGLHAAGKSTFASFLRQTGWALHSTGDVIREEARRRGIEESFEGLGMVSKDFLEHHQADIIPRLGPQISKSINQVGFVVVDGVKTELEVAQLRVIYPKVVVISIVASIPLRLERILARNRKDDPKTLEELVLRDAWELRGGVQRLFTICDQSVRNDGTPDNLRTRAQEFSSSIRPRRSEKSR